MTAYVYDTTNPAPDQVRADILSGSHQTPTMLSKSQCPQCDATQRALAKKGLEAGVDYRVVKIDVPEHEDLFNHAKHELGAASAPVLIYQGESFSGFRPDLIDGLISRTTWHKHGNSPS